MGQIAHDCITCIGDAVFFMVQRTNTPEPKAVLSKSHINTPKDMWMKLSFLYALSTLLAYG